MASSFVLAAARKDLVRRLRDPFAFLIWLGIPVVLAGLIGVIGRGGVKPRGRLLVADLDGTFLSRGVATAFAQKPLSDYFDVEAVEEKTGRERMDAGDASALLVIPRGFAHGILVDEPCRLDLVKNPSQQILPAMAEETLSMFAEAVFYLQRVAGDRLRGQLSKIADAADAGDAAITEAFVADFSVEIRRTVERISTYLSPAVLAVDVEPEAKPEGGGAPAADFGSLFFPSMIFMTLFFMAQGLSEDVWHEKSGGTLRRALATPRSAGALLAGKFAAGGVTLLGVAIFGLALSTSLFGFHWRVVPLGAAWIVASGLVFLGLMTCVQLFAGSQRAGHLLANTIVFPLIMIGGSFFPFEAMPAWMAAIGKRTPNGWALEILKAILFERAGAGEVAAGFAGLAAVFAVLFVVCKRRLSGAFARNA